MDKETAEPIESKLRRKLAVTRLYAALMTVAFIGGEYLHANNMIFVSATGIQSAQAMPKPTVEEGVYSREDRDQLTALIGENLR